MELPPAGTPPRHFFEEFVPKAFAAAELSPDAREVEVSLGIRLLGEEGGDWLFHLRRGDLAVEPGSVEVAAFTLVQTVEDWRGALWEGRGGVFGRQSRAMFEPGAGAGGPGGGLPPSALAQLQALNGMIRMVVAGGPGGDWAVAFKLGSGPVPEQATTTVTVSAEDADALERGQLDPMQAFMSGRLRVEGDMALLMQMQGIQMQASAMAAAKPGSGG
jgi:hypothetical protein